MATITSRKLIDELIANDGYFEDDPPIEKIVEYTNASGETAWGVVWTTDKTDKDRYEKETYYVRKPKVIWQRKVQ